MEDKIVMVYGETFNGALSTITTELLGCGRRLTNKIQGELICVLIGDDLEKPSVSAISYGADKVYQISHPALKDHLSDIYVTELERVVKKFSPRILIFGQNGAGRDLAPRLAFRLHAGLIMDCLRLDINPETEQLEQEKPVYGGNVRAVYITNSVLQLVTIRKKIMLPVEPDNSRKGEIITDKIEIDYSQILYNLIDTIKEEDKKGIKLEDASVIVAGGRGIGDVSGFKNLYDLAEILNGAVGASKHPCDYEWISDSAQIGLTGKIVAPELYIAIGISGATQHITGCSGSKNIIAINKDKDANIFKYARYGVIGDWKEVLPAFTERIRKLMEN